MQKILPDEKPAELVQHQEHVFSGCASMHPAKATVSTAVTSLPHNSLQTYTLSVLLLSFSVLAYSALTRLTGH